MLPLELLHLQQNRPPNQILKLDPQNRSSRLGLGHLHYRCLHHGCLSCSTCEGPSTGPTKIRSLVVHVANDHCATDGSSAAVDSSALKLELIRFSDGKSMELPLASTRGSIKAGRQINTVSIHLRTSTVSSVETHPCCLSSLGRSASRPHRLICAAVQPVDTISLCHTPRCRIRSLRRSEYHIPSHTLLELTAAVPPPPWYPRHGAASAPPATP